MDEKESLANAITKALAYQENGGKLDLNKISAGQSGEMKSIFQFTPDTWKTYSHEVFGKEMPLNNDNETYVVNEKVKKWIDEGKNTSQIASMWNAGPGRPNAYKENWKGKNKYGIEYDTPTYAKNVLDYAKKFYKKEPDISNTQPQNSSTEPANISSVSVPQNGLLGKAISESKLKI